MEDINVESDLWVYNAPEQTIFIDLENSAQIEIVKNNLTIYGATKEDIYKHMDENGLIKIGK